MAKKKAPKNAQAQAMADQSFVPDDPKLAAQVAALREPPPADAGFKAD